MEPESPDAPPSDEKNEKEFRGLSEPATRNHLKGKEQRIWI